MAAGRLARSRVAVREVPVPKAASRSALPSGVSTVPESTPGTVRSRNAKRPRLTRDTVSVSHTRPPWVLLCRLKAETNCSSGDAPGRCQSQVKSSLLYAALGKLSAS